MTKKYFAITILQVAIIVGGLIYLVVAEHQAKVTLQAKNKLLRYAAFRANLDNERLTWTRQEADRLQWYWTQTRLQHGEWTTVVEKIYFYSKVYGVRPELAMSVAHRESYFIPEAKSNVAWGIFQINLEVWKNELNLNEQNVLDLDTNIRCGIQILKRYLDDCGNDEVRALNKYWCGSPVPPHDGYLKRIYSSKFYGGK